MAKQLSDMFDREILENMQCYVIRDGKFIFTPIPEGGFLEPIRRDNETV